jgi:hypothetical protein
VAAATEKAYAPFVARFRNHCQLRACTDLQHAPSDLGITFLMEEFNRAYDGHLGAGSLAKASAAASWYCDLLNVPSVMRCPLAQRALAGAKKVLLTAKPCARQPVTQDDLLRLARKYIYEPQASGRPLHLPDVMMVVSFVLMFAGFMRYNEAAAVLVHEECMVFGLDSTGPGFVELFIPRSKTDQMWEGSVVRVEGTGGQLCPVRLLRLLLELGGYQRTAGLQEDCGPLMRATTRGPGGKHVLAQVVSALEAPIPPLACAMVSKRLQTMLASVGVLKRVSSHSLRIGAASTADARRVAAQFRVAQGRWRCLDVALMYVRPLGRAPELCMLEGAQLPPGPSLKLHV